ncbi:MAG: cyclic nucleotide-binding domain-containing protein [Burkholderiales bacterium]|nr:cyclic nucleotide-binding domain-containing protein [Burkholderiales bacterium]
MSVIDYIGWGAGALVLATFYLKTMIPLRSVAIASNVAFIAYGTLAGLTPILVLHALLLPINILRLQQMRLLITRVKRASRGDLSLEMLVPYMKKRTLPAGSQLFTKGEYSEEVFLILKGRVRIVGRGVIIKTGQMVGEMGIFAPGQMRTDSAVCETEVELASVSEDQLWELFYQNPEFGAYLLRIIVHRSASTEHQGTPSIIKV